MNTSRRIAILSLSIFCAGALVAGVASGADVGTKTGGRVGTTLSITGNGRHLTPAGRLTTVGNFPSGSALTPDGKFLWTISSGHGRNDVTIVNVATGAVTQTLPLPGAYGGVAISADGTKAYVSGEPQGSSPAPALGTLKGVAGDVIHTYSIATNGTATEGDLIDLPKQPGGDKIYPGKLAISPDGSKLAVIEIQSRTCLGAWNGVTCTGGSIPQGKVAIINTSTGAATEALLAVSSKPHDVAFSPDGTKVYATDEQGGTFNTIDVATHLVTDTTGVGGGGSGDGTGDKFSHPEGFAISSDGGTAWVAVANRDLVAKVDLSTHAVSYTDLSRSPAWGVQPVAVAISGNRVYVADSGEDAVAVLDTTSSPATLAGRIPTAAYPTGVAVTGGTLIWTAAKGLGSGANPAAANPGTGTPNHKYWGSEYFPYGKYIPDALLGRVGVLAQPNSAQLASYTAQADAQVKPENFTSAPPATALTSNGPIKYVFYVVRENRTYDQVFGSNTRGDGDPKLQLFDDNGVKGVTGGVTPNAHALAKRFPLLDHFYANSEVSVDGHIITAMGQAVDFSQRELHANYSNRGRLFDFIYPISFAPKTSIFDQAVRQNVSSMNYGENESGSSVVCAPYQGPSCVDPSDDGRSTYKAVKAANDRNYPQTFGCAADPKLDAAVKKPTLLNSKYCETDSSVNGLNITVFGQKLYHSRFDYWKKQFDQQLATNTVPKLTYITFPNDHTNGVKTGLPTPSALVADNDLAVGQFVQAISKSKIWNQSAIFVVEDDSQDGADHVDSHRMPAFVISPWAKQNTAVHTRYDQNSALRSAMILLGLQPLTLADGLATPMYDAFMRTTDTPATASYTAIKPKYSLTTVATSTTLRKVGPIAATLPFNQLDQVPQTLFDMVIWKSIFGNSRAFPGSGPNPSPAEAARAASALKAFRSGKSVSKALAAATPKGDQRTNVSPVAEVSARRADRER